MSEELKVSQAKNAYGIICSALDAQGWRYQTHEDKLLVVFGVNGDDIPMDFLVSADADRQLIRLHSPLNFKVSESKRMDVAVAVCVINNKMADGCFELDIGDGGIVFKMTATYRDSQISEELVRYIINCSCAMVDKYNDQFLAIDKGILSIGDFVAQNS